ncbi:MAG: hypothetical protein ACYTEQ_22090 [Planctomycetota bacterium]|jgi:hypothetical protein
MARFGEHRRTTIQAKEDLNTDGHQYQAIAFDDGKVANSGGEAGGILINKPENGEHANIGYDGEMKYRAGGAVAAGKAITVVTSGYFTAAGSGDYIVGRNSDAAVNSGSVGTGFFDFKQPIYAQMSAYAW